MTLVKIAAGLATLYLVVVALLALAQDWLLFPRWALPARSVVLPASAERLELEIASGERLIGIYLPASQRPPDEAALVLGFGGNAWDADALALYLQAVSPDRNIVTFHYRGYGPSQGHPSARALLQDSIQIHDYLLATLRPAGIVAVGLSVGAGPAAHLGSRRPVTGLILVTPFDSLKALAREHYSWAPVDLLLRHEMETADAVTASSAPVAIITAEQDTIVPPDQSRSVRSSAERLVLDRVIGGAGHNDLYQRDEFMQAMREALALIEANAPAPLDRSG